MKRALLLAVLSLAVFSPSLLAAGIPVGGRVLSPDGKPLANARVALVPYPAIVEIGKLEIAGKTAPEPAATAMTGADGTFLLNAPGVGMWKVRAESPGFVPVEAFLLPLLEETDLPDAQLSSDVRLQVKLTDAQGRPVAGARVRVDDSRNATRGPDGWATARRLAVTDAAGAAVVSRAADEVLTVQAAAAGSPVAKAEGVKTGAVSLRLAAARTRQVLVRDAKGKPAAGAVVYLGNYEWPLALTSEAGLAGVSLPGEGLDLNVAAEDGRRVAGRVRPARPEETGPAVVTLPDAAPATGKVISSQDGRPVAGALAWPARDYGRTVRSEADGTLRFPVLADPEGAVEAAAPGFFPEDGEVSGGRLPTLSLQPRIAASGVVVDEAGRPVAGAALVASFLPGPRLMRSQAVYRSGGFTRSGAAGRFRLSSLAAGVAYELKATRPGFAPARLELPARESGQPAPELRIVMKTGRGVFGLVVDAGRRPVAGARVTLRAAPPSDLMARMRAARNPEPPAGGSTDAAGRFEVNNLPAGSYDLQVRAPGFARLTVPGLAVPEGTGKTDLGTVMLAPGLALRGLVTDAQGRPVAGAEVRARAATRDRMDFLPNRGDPGPADALTADDGSFALEDRSPGESLDLTVSHAGYGPGAAPGVAVPSEAPVRIVLNATARVSGRAVDPDGKPVAGASIFLSEETSVSLEGQTMISSSGRFHRATSDEEGGFSVADVSPGPIRIYAQAPRRQRTELENLEVKAGQDLTGVDVVLLLGGSVEGRVLGPDGNPVREAQVSVVEATPADMVGFSRLSATTDGDGRYQIDAVPPGAHTLEARAEGYRRAVRDVEVAAKTAAVDFRLERGLEVSGRVVDDGGNPVPGVQITLLAGRDFLNAPGALSGGDGTFRVAGVQDGSYRVRTRKEGYVSFDPQAQTVTVAGAPVSGLELRISAGGTITGKLSGLDLGQLSRVRVVADGTMSPGRVDPEGNYQIPHVPPGSWKVDATVPGTPLHAEGTVKLEPGVPEARLDLQFGNGRELRGVVLSNGQPVAGASLLLTGTGTAALQTATSDYQGSFRFGGLDDGAYKLQVSTPKGAQHEESVEIAGDREIRVELRTASLSGRVVDAQDASPVSGVQISLQSAAEGGLSPFGGATSDGHGAFRLLEVGEGSWKLKAVREGYAATEREVQVEGGTEPETVEIRMEPTEGITVEAALPSGQAPDRLRVAVLGPDGRAMVSGNYPTGENGRARLANVPPGSWRLLIESDQSAPALAAVSVPGPPIHVALPLAGQVRVQIPALAGGNASAKVVLNGAGGPYQAMDWDGSVKSEWELFNGSRTFQRVGAGVWQVTARAADGQAFTGTVTVTPGGEAEVVLK